MKLFNTSDIALVKQCQGQFNFTPALHSSVAARNLCTSFVALTSSRDQAIVYVRYTSIDIVLPLYFFLLFFVPFTIFVVFDYHMW